MGLAETIARRRAATAARTAAVPPTRLACRRLARKAALKAAGVSAMPVAGVDLFVNGHLLAGTLGTISSAYGLSPEQIARLPAPVRTRLETLTRQVGSYIIGRSVTQAVVMQVLQSAGVRIGAQQAAKLAPVVGLAASGAISGWLFLRICDRHIAHCEEIARQLPQLQAPADPLVIDI
ncbi:hypothetical protein [Rivibacter subsaxonicus]|uniref:DUF697 domain-containing protein n=1 Tax=Rivibacter subsaxonicus TaxID=457575 RepID=A0A4Q7VWV0_9BURK|nr:hypothetical protein [Rivibacter subsaxonicus]RZU01160.1 hypothetical protein EV670_1876 [Rivibacter subsaxonicus]